MARYGKGKAVHSASIHGGEERVLTQAQVAGRRTPLFTSERLKGPVVWRPHRAPRSTKTHINVPFTACWAFHAG